MAAGGPASHNLVTPDEVAARLIELVGSTRPAVIAVEGRSSSGKSTLAGRLAEVLPHAAVVHTDDLAWHHSVLGWAELLVTGILGPVRAGQGVVYRPPAWDKRGRLGAIEVPAGIAFLLAEGVGVSRRELAPQFDAVCYLDTSPDVRAARDAVRVAAGEISPQGYKNWMREEDAHFAADRPWERADLVVRGDS